MYNYRFFMKTPQAQVLLVEFYYRCKPKTLPYLAFISISLFNISVQHANDIT